MRADPPAHDAAAIAERLLPCPFCGWTAGTSVFDNGDEPYWVECADCFAQGGIGETRIAAVTAWNTRASLAQSKGEE